MNVKDLLNEQVDYFRRKSVEAGRNVVELEKKIFLLKEQIPGQQIAEKLFDAAADELERMIYA